MNFEENVYLKVTDSNGNSYTIIPDGLEKNGSGQYKIHEAKFSDVKDLDTYDKLDQTFTTNQRPAFDAIANDPGVKVELKNSRGGRQLMGDVSADEIRGLPVTIDKTINVYVNSSQGIKVRKYP